MTLVFHFTPRTDTLWNLLPYSLHTLLSATNKDLKHSLWPIWLQCFLLSFLSTPDTIQAVGLDDILIYHLILIFITYHLNRIQSSLNIGSDYIQSLINIISYSPIKCQSKNNKTAKKKNEWFCFPLPPYHI